MNSQMRHCIAQNIFLEFRTWPILDYFLRYLSYKRSRFLCLTMPLAPPDVGLFRTSATYYSSIVSVILGDGGLVTELCVVCMCPGRGLVRVVHTANNTQLLPTGLRAGAFCEWVGGSDVTEISPKTLCASILVLSSGKPFFGRSHSWKVAQNDGRH